MVTVIIVLAVLQVLDVWTTHINLKVLGPIEPNPIGRWLWKRWAQWGLLVAKIVGMAAVWLILVLAREYLGTATRVVLALACAGYAYVDVMNFWVYWKEVRPLNMERHQ